MSSINYYQVVGPEDECAKHGKKYMWICPVDKSDSNAIYVSDHIHICCKCIVEHAEKEDNPIPEVGKLQGQVAQLESDNVDLRIKLAHNTGRAYCPKCNFYGTFGIGEYKDAEDGRRLMVRCHFCYHWWPALEKSTS